MTIEHWKTIAIGAVGFVLSSALTTILGILTDYWKDRREIKKTILLKKLETAESFLSRYENYLFTFKELSHVLKSHKPGISTTKNEQLNLIMKNCLDEIVNDKYDVSPQGGALLLYFDIESIDSTKSLKLSEDFIKVKEFIAIGTPLKDDFLQLLTEMTTTIDEFISQGEGYILKIREAIKKDLE